MQKERKQTIFKLTYTLIENIHNLIEMDAMKLHSQSFTRDNSSSLASGTM